MRTTRKPWWNARDTRASGALLAGACAGAWALAGCGADPFGGGRDGFSAEQWERVLELEPLSVPLGPSPHNEYADSDAAAQFGHELFFDKEFSSPVRVAGPSGAVGQAGMVSCATCHDPREWFSDARPTEGVSHGVG